MKEIQPKLKSPIVVLTALRDDFSDEIPDEIIHGPVSETNPKKFKVRRNWWNYLVGTLERMQLKNQIPNQLETDVTSFLNHYTSEVFRDQPLTYPEDIAKANNLITAILEQNESAM